MAPPWAPTSGQQNSYFGLSSSSFRAPERRGPKGSLPRLSRGSSLKDLQEPQDPKGWSAPQAHLAPQDSLGTLVCRALLAAQESLALMGSGAYQAL